MIIGTPFLQKHNDIVDQLCEVIIKNNIPPPDSEALLLYCAGFSAGLRFQGIENAVFIHPLRVGWATAAQFGDL